MSHVLEVNELIKDYGPLRAVNKLSIQLEKGRVYGILGPNGSGKTTTLGVLLGTINDYHGNFSWFQNGNKNENRKRIGAILEQPNFYKHLSAKNNLKIIALLKNVTEDDIYRVAKIVDLDSRLNDPYKSYSLGMKQRLGIAAALLGNPEVLVLDEPTNGLDPKGIIDIRELIQKIASQGITILIASHMLDEVQKVCSHVCIIQNGITKAQGKLSEIMSGDQFLEISSENMDKLKETLLTFGPIEEKDLVLEKNLIMIRLNKEIDVPKINAHILNSGVSLTHFSTRSKSLEEFFIQTTEQ